MTPEKRRRFGRRLRGARNRLRLTQAVMATRVGVSEATVSRWETGRHEPDIPQRSALDQLFGRPLEEVCGVDPGDWDTDGPKQKPKTRAAVVA